MTGQIIALCVRVFDDDATGRVARTPWVAFGVFFAAMRLEF